MRLRVMFLPPFCWVTQGSANGPTLTRSPFGYNFACCGLDTLSI